VGNTAGAAFLKIKYAQPATAAGQAQFAAPAFPVIYVVVNEHRV